MELSDRVSDDAADPPGQQGLFIPPGDLRREDYRLYTFKHFPVTCPISRKSLAKSGFFFTGFYDRVKCFACARTVEWWETEETDNPAELIWHKPNCPFAIRPVVPAAGSSSSAAHYANQTTNQGERISEQRDPNTSAIIRRVIYPADLPERIRQTGGTFEIGPRPNNEVIIQSGPGPGQRNPAIVVGLQATQQQPRRQWRMANVISADHKRFLTNLFLNRELDRLASFARWPTGRPNIAPAYLAKTGFFYLGDMDRTQCFSCGGVLRNWNLEDDAEAEHRTHFPQCRMVVNTESRNIPVHENPETEEEKARKYLLRFPANPHMRSENARLETFDRRWPMGKTAATPAEIAQGGFFFIGDRDRAKCWYCNGGLQNWEYDDIPWIEHAKWFPNCQFLLRVKGQHFVYHHLALNPHLPRPIIARQDGSPLESVGGQPAVASGGQFHARRSQEPREIQPPAPPPVNISSQTTNQGERISEQPDPNTGAIIRRVIYPADLPERIRQTGGTFEIGPRPNNEVIIQSGPGPGQRNPAIVVGLQATQQQPRRQWRMANVISADHKRFLTNLFLNRELDRLSSFGRWPTGRPNIAPAYLAKTGFFYLGDMDRTQCFSCRGVLENWNREADVEAKHRTHFPQCLMVHNLESRNIPVHEHPDTEEERERKYPLRFPANPHMRNENARLETFDRRWPMGKTAATPAEIAQAGLFFLGDGDRAKCWYCNGGLQNWEYDYIPWIEHAKWFPNCQFLLRVKGQHFVYHHLALNPHLPRPIIARQDGSPLESVGGQPAVASGGQFHARRSQEPREIQPPAPPPVNISSQIASVLEDRINIANEDNPGEGRIQLLEEIEREEEEDMEWSPYEDVNEPVDESERKLHLVQEKETAAEERAKSLQETLDKMEEERSCKICFTNRADMVFVPCAHLCCCMECTQAISQCPLCRKSIDKAVKTYMA